MSLRSKLTRAGLMLGLLASLSLPVLAQQPETTAPGPDTQRSERGPRHRRKGGGEMGFLRILRQLDLTESQQQQARLIIENHLAAIKPQRDELMKLREQREQGADQADISSRAKELREQLHESSKNLRTQLLAVLTPDQRTRFDQMETEFKARREQMRERHRRDTPENDQQ